LLPRIESGFQVFRQGLICAGVGYSLAAAFLEQARGFASVSVFGVVGLLDAVQFRQGADDFQQRCAL